jgi:hypothetical protein
MPAEMNPVRKRNATVSSESPFSSAFMSDSCDWLCGLWRCTFVNGVDVWPLKPVCGVHQQVDREEALPQLPQAVSIRFHVTLFILFVCTRDLGDCRFA